MDSIIDNNNSNILNTNSNKNILRFGNFNNNNRQIK